MTQKIYHINENFLSSSKFFLLKNIFKVALHYLFNIFILFNTISYLRLNFKLKIDLKCELLKTWKKFVKPGKFFEKTSGNPDSIKNKYRLIGIQSKNMFLKISNTIILFAFLRNKD